MNRFREIYLELEEIRDREAIRLFRLARKALLHGCSERLAVRIQNEGWKVQRMYAGDLLNPFNKWEFAFRFWEVVL